MLGLSFTGWLSGCATLERDAVVVSAGASYSEHSPATALGELKLAGVVTETRVAMPAGFYGLAQLRNERGDGLQGGVVTDNDYIRMALELGWDFGLPFNFVGGVGLNFVQADLDARISIDGTPLSVAVNREDYGGRLRLARVGDWLTVAGEIEVSPAEEAVAAIYELESGRRFGPVSLALRYGQYPEIAHAALMLRYRFFAGSERPLIPQKPLPSAPEAPVELTLDPRMDGESDRAATARPPLAPPRPEWFDEKPEPPPVEYAPKKLPDGRPEWFADDPPRK